MLSNFENNWIQKFLLLSSEFFSSNYFQVGQHVVLLHKYANSSTLPNLHLTFLRKTIIRTSCHIISYLLSEESTLPFGTQSNLFLKVVNASLCGRSISKPYNDLRRKWLCSVSKS